MGCDIHFVIEQKYNDKWIGVQKDWSELEPFDYNNLTKIQKLRSRNYNFFGLLADVRTSCQSSEDPRGLPEDISELAQAEVEDWGVDGHSRSWHSLEEFVKKFLLANADDTGKAELMKRKLQGENPVYDFFPDLDPDRWCDYRVVFWFNN